jgi:cancer susceptibility candidate protein 1
MILPSYVFVETDANHRIGVWDDESETWSEQYAEEISYDAEKRMLSFSLNKFAPIAYLQARCTDYPYDSWYLRCVEKEIALLTIKTKRIEINFEIHDLFIKLVDMEQP